MPRGFDGYPDVRKYAVVFSNEIVTLGDKGCEAIKSTTSSNRQHSIEDIELKGRALRADRNRNEEGD